MAITITQARKRQRYLLLALALTIFVILIVAWLGFFQKKGEVKLPSEPAVIYIMPQVRIDWQMLDELKNENFEPFEEISAFRGKFGRENPFIPY